MRTKILLGLFLFSMVVVSCECDKRGEDQRKKMSFSSKMELQTKSLVMDDVKLGKEGFGLMIAITEKGSFSDNSSINTKYNFLVKKEESDSWTDPNLYWPYDASDLVSFFAYAPYVLDGNNSYGISLSNNTKQGYPTITYNAENSIESIKKHTDLCYDVKLNRNYEDERRREDASGDDGKVYFVLKHALTKVMITARMDTNLFIAKNDEGNEIGYKINRIVLKNIKKDGIMTMKESPVWATRTLVDYELSTDNGGLVEINEANKYQKINASDCDMLLLPQDLVANATLEVEILDPNNKVSTLTSSVRFSDFSLTKFGLGKSVNLIINIKKTTMDIGFVVVPWSNKEFDIEINEGLFTGAITLNVKGWITKSHSTIIDGGITDNNNPSIENPSWGGDGLDTDYGQIGK